ncbi:MAG: hypothetical protein AAF790_03520 [Planctomycetota bacterium]
MSTTKAPREPGPAAPRQPTTAGLLMPGWSRYRGQPLDGSSRHSIRITGVTAGGLDAADATGDSIDRGPGSVVTAEYFYDEGRFWRAEVPLDGVREVYGQAYNFSRIVTRKGADGPETVFTSSGLPKRSLPILNHVQTRFRFDPREPVRLTAMDGSGDARTTDDIVYSIEAAGPPGIVFNFRDAAGGNLVCAHRFMTTREMAFERLAVEGQYVAESPLLLLEPGEERALLAKSLQRSHRAGMDEAYYLFRLCGTNNCTSNPFKILDEVVNYTWPQWLCALDYRLPLNPRLYLWLRGLDSAPGEFKLLREEFAEFLAEPDTRRRRREHVRRAIADRRQATGGDRKPSKR